MIREISPGAIAAGNGRLVNGEQGAFLWFPGRRLEVTSTPKPPMPHPSTRGRRK